MICSPSSDVYALEIMKELKDKNIKIPDEIGIMGFDDLDILKYISPRLSTISYPTDLIGNLAVEMLLDIIEGKEKKQICLDHRIISGETL